MVLMSIFLVKSMLVIATVLTNALLVSANSSSSNVTIDVDYYIDSAYNVSNCLNSDGNPNPNGLCNLRSAWHACQEANNVSSETTSCSINLPEKQSLFFDYKYGPLTVDPHDDVAINGNDCSIYYERNQTNSSTAIAETEWDDIDNSVFPMITGVLTDTTSAMQGTAVACVTDICYGDMLKFSACGSPSSVGDTYFRLYDAYGSEVAQNDDTCQLVSEIEYTATGVGTASCGEYCLHVGCYGSDTCGPVEIVASVKRAAVAPAETSGVDDEFPLYTGPLVNTSDATVDTAVGCVNACYRDVIMFTGCDGTNSTNTTGDSVYRLVSNSSGFEVAFNDNTCGQASEIVYTVADLTCGEYCLHVGCKGNSSCSAVVEALAVVAPVIPESEILGDFPLTTPVMRDTDYAQANYTSACLTACQLDTLTFSACNGDTSQDTYFRLFAVTSDNTGGVDEYTQVATSDDACGAAAEIVYVVTSDGCGQQFCLHVGCADDVECSATVAVYTSRSNAVLPNFMMYQQNTTNTNSTGPASTTATMGHPSVRLSNLTLYSFGNSAINGGTLYFNGPINATIDTVTVADSTGNLGGAVYVSNTGSGVVSMSSCTVLESTAGVGGAVFVDRIATVYMESSLLSGCSATALGGMDVGGGGVAVNTLSSFIMTNCSITDCSGAFGGAVFVNLNNSVQLRGSDMVGCTAEYDGGGLYANHYNDHLLVRGTTFDSCSVVSQGAGGGVTLSADNKYVVIDTCYFYKLTGRIGAGMAVSVGNDHLVVTNSVFQACVGVNGGGLYIGSSYGPLQNATISGCSFLDCEGYWGGGVEINFFTTGVTITDSMFSGCTAEEGGAMMVANTNTNLSFTDSIVTDCSSTGFGGGLRLSSDNLAIRVSNVSFTATSGSSGGAVFVASNNQISLDSITITNCSALSGAGGGINVDTGNDDFSLTNSILKGNTAVTNGGGVAFGSKNNNAIFAGTQLRGNSAGAEGGGIYVGSDNNQMSTMDGTVFPYYTVVETTHPYSFDSQGLIMSQTVQGPSDLVEGFVITFTPETYLGQYIFLILYDSSEKNTFITYFENDFPGTTLPAMTIPLSSFYIELRSFYFVENQYGFKMTCYPIARHSATPVIIEGNSAATGGGIAMDYTNNFAVLLNTVLSSNQATGTAGGGAYFRNMNTGPSLTAVTFDSNSAVDGGGGAWFSTSHFGLQLANCTFSNNIVSNYGRGGALLFSNDNGDGMLTSGNEVAVTSSIFTANKAGVGGALFLSISNVVTVQTSVFSANEASIGDGGAILMDELNQITLQESVVEGNFATVNGGGLVAIATNKLFITNSTFTGNTANGTGGALSLSGGSLGTITGHVYIIDNSASLNGGGVAIINSPLLALVPPAAYMHLCSNHASRGSALFITGLVESTNSVTNVTFADNSASVGGTVFWLADSSMSSPPPGVTVSDPSVGVQWGSNAAAYGPRVATQAVGLSGPDTVPIQTYNAPLSPPLEITIYDYYDQFVPINATTTVSASVAVPVLQHTACTSYPYLSGSDLTGAGVGMESGYARFAALSAVCSPGGWMDVMFTAAVGDVVGTGVQSQQSQSQSQSYSVSNSTRLEFRACIAGEVQTDGQCVPCADGSYNLEALVPCDSCFDNVGIDHCNADQLVLREGFWRRFPGNSEVLRCPLSPASCPGGNLTGETSCGLGYSGELCAVCADGYFRQDDGCELCSGTHMVSPTAIVLGCVLLLVMGSAIASLGYYKKCVDALLSNGSAAPTGNETGDGHAPHSPSRLLGVVAWASKNYGRLVSKLKITLATFQIVSVVATVVDVSMPNSFVNFVNGIKFVNLSIVSLVPIGCTNKFTFIDTLIMVTMAPICAVCLLVVAFVFSYSSARRAIQDDRNRKKGDKQRKFNEIKARYLGYFFYLTYLVLPSVTTTISQMFVCTDVDPAREDPEQEDWFLTADMSISCTSDYFYGGVAYACIMILVYPVGVTSLYFALLYERRGELVTRNDPGSAEIISEKDSMVSRPTDADADADADADMDATDERYSGAVDSQHAGRRTSATAARISFLWQAYKPAYWYWEIVETSRRLMLTAVLSVCDPGTSEQSLLSILLALLYIKLYGYCNPYDGGTDNVLAEIGQFQIYFTFLGAMIVQESMVDSQLNVLVGYSLVFINLSVIGYILNNELQKHWDDEVATGTGNTKEQLKGSLADIDTDTDTEASNPIHALEMVDIKNNKT